MFVNKSILKNITIIIVAYKSSDVIFKCLEKIRKFPNILILDNSNDKVIFKKIKKKYKKIKFFLSKTNTGYAKGNNILLKKVKTPYALILNPDCFVSHIEIKKIFTFKTLLKENFLAIGHKSGANIRNKKKIGKFKYFICNYIKGYFMFINMKAIKKINYFDENFFMYLEEIDLCKRANINNFKIIALNNLRIYHLAGKSSNDRKEFSLIQNWNWMWSQYYFYKKYNGLIKSLIKFIPKLVYLYLKKLLFFKNKIYQSRYSGLRHSMIGKSSKFKEFRKTS